MSRIVSGLLALSGVVLLYIGASVLVAPHAFYLSNEIVLGTDPSPLSEVRAPAGLLVLSGLLVGRGAFWRAYAPTSLAVAAAVYGTYGLSRLVGVLVDGWPSTGLVAAMGIELVLGAVTGALWWTGRLRRSAG